MDNRLNPDRPTASRGWERALLLAALFAALGVLLALAWPAFQGRIHVFDDAGSLHLPMRAFHARCLAQGDSFLWMPNLFCGFYLHGEGQAGLLHPVHLALYRFLPLPLAFFFEFFLSYPFMLLGMCLFLRRHRLPAYAAVLGGSLYAFSATHLMHYHHLNLVSVGAHIPWALLAVDLALTGRTAAQTAGGRLGLVLIAASQLLLGFPQVFWFTTLTEALYVLFLGRAAWTWRRLAGLAAALGVGVLVAGVQVLPTLDAAAGSTRDSVSLAFRLTRSLVPLRLAELVSPYLFAPRDHEFGVYAGAGTLLLALLALGRRRALGEHRRLATGALVMAGLALLLALGKYGLIQIAVAKLPIVGVFRVPARYLMLFHLAMAAAAAVGMVELVRLATAGPRPRWRQWRWLLLPLAGAGLVAALALLPRWVESDRPLMRLMAGRLASGGPLALGVLLAALAAALTLAAWRGGRGAAVALVVFVTLDTALYGLSYIGAHPTQTVAEYVAQLPDPPAQGGRTAHSAPTNALALRGLRLSTGCMGLPPSSAAYQPDRPVDPLREHEQDRSYMRLAGVRWVVDGPDRVSWLKEEPPNAPFGWELPDPLPRARLVSRAVVSANPRAALRELDPASTAVVGQSIALDSGAPGEARIEQDRPGRLVIHTQAQGRQLLVLSERYHAGWRAAIDGEPAPVARAYGLFMAVPVPAGAHTVALRFDPDSWRWGWRVTAAGVALMALQFVAGMWTPRRARRTRRTTHTEYGLERAE